MLNSITPIEPIAVDEDTLASKIGMSIHWLRKDRRGKRQIPFYKIGTSIRYSLDRVRDALAALEEGGVKPRGVKK